MFGNTRSDLLPGSLACSIGGANRMRMPGDDVYPTDKKKTTPPQKKKKKKKK